MKIITRLKLAAWVPALMALVISLALLFSYKAMEEAQEKGNTVHQIQISMNELNSFAHSYMLFHEERPRLQFLKEYDSITRLMATIRFDNSEQQQLLDRIRANSESMKASFVKLASGYQRRRAVESDALLREAGARLAGQILVRSREVLSDAFQLDSLINDEITTTQRRISALIFFLIVTTTIPLTIVLIRMMSNITTSLATLRKGTEVIGAGNLDHRIGMPIGNELGDLARSFDFMTEQLKVTTVSRDALSKEVEERKRAQEELRQQREWLRITLSSIGDGVIASDIIGGITFLNSVAVTLTGWQSEEALGQPIQSVFRIINEKTREPAEDLVARVLHEKRVVGLANDTALVTKDGRELPIEDSAAPIKDSAGNAIGVVLVFHDVTEKRRAQMELREAHERATWLARFPDENPNPVLRASAEGSVLYCNPSSVEIHGWACEVGRPLRHPLLPLVGQAMAEKREVEEDVKLGERLYSVWVTPFPKEGYANVYGRDITEHKRAEEALRENEKRYRSYIEMTEQLGWSTNADGDVAEDIPSWRKFTGQSEEEVKGWGWSKALHPDDLEHTARVWRNAVATRNKYEVEYRIRRYDGVYRHFLARGVPIFKDDGNILEWVGTCVDITERKRAEEALRESEQRLSRAQEIAHLGSWELDLLNNRLTWSDEVYRIFGLQPQEFGATYEAFLEAVHPGDRDTVDAAYSASLREGIDTYEIEHRVVRKSTGETRTVHERCEHLRDASGEIIRSIGMVHDITERKRADQALRERTLELQELSETLEQQVQERTEELKKANEALRHLSLKLLSAQEEERKRIAGEIHDTLGACLSAIKFKVESVLQGITKTPNASIESLGTIVPVIQEGVEECRRIQMDLRPSMLDDLGLLPTLSWFCRRFQTIYSGIRVDQEVTIEESEVPVSLKVVAFRVTQEAMNNVAKHSKANTVRLCLRKIDGRMEITVEDNGQGFDLEKVLGPGSESRGLGLTNMRERAELSGGSFEMASTQGKGTVIRVWWPLPAK